MPNLTAHLQRRIFARHMRQQVRPERFASFGEGSFIAPPLTCEFPQHVRIGSRVEIGPDAFISCPDRFNGREHRPLLSIGDRTRFGRGLVIACNGRMEIGEDVLTSDRILIADTYHGYEDPDTPIREQPLAEPRTVRIGSGSHLGLGAMVLPGVTIGRNALIGAGAVVTGDVPDNAVAVGNPARIVRWYDRPAGVWRDGAPPAA